MDLFTNTDYTTLERIYSVRMNERDFQLLQEMILEKVANKIAEQVIAENFSEIVALIDPQAIANMTVAAAGAKINETLNKKMPDKILEIRRRGDTEIYQSGLFGSLKRIR